MVDTEVSETRDLDHHTQCMRCEGQGRADQIHNASIKYEQMVPMGELE